MEFYGAVSAQVRDFDMVHTWRERKLSSGNPREPSFDIELKVQEGQDKVRLYGSSVVVEVAEQIRSHLIRTLNALDDAEATAEHLVELALEEGALLRMIRADLGIPVGAIEVVGLY
jgi:hypothetical protein